ncbi:5612_t:CDS:2, partial [Funneliformis caledonium]
MRDRLLKVNFGLKWRLDAKLEIEKCGPYKMDESMQEGFQDILSDEEEASMFMQPSEDM